MIALGPRLFALAALGLAAFMLYGSLAPSLAPPGEYGFDKFLHAGAYGLLAGLLTLSTRTRNAGVAAIALAIGYGGLVEIAQSFVPERNGSWEDFAANSIGAVLAGGVILARRRG